MNTSRILTIVFVLLLVTSVGVAYYRYMVQENFLVKYQTPCDPAVESCFMYECDPEAEEGTISEKEEMTDYTKSSLYRKYIQREKILERTIFLDRYFRFIRKLMYKSY